MANVEILTEQTRSESFVDFLEQFKAYQRAHYDNRLKEARSPKEASFLRQTLHGLKKSNTDDNTIPSFDYSTSVNTNQFQKTQKPIL